MKIFCLSSADCGNGYVGFCRLGVVSRRQLADPPTLEHGIDFAASPRASNSLRQAKLAKTASLPSQLRCFDSSSNSVAAASPVKRAVLLFPKKSSFIVRGVLVTFMPVRHTRMPTRRRSCSEAILLVMNVLKYRTVSDGLKGARGFCPISIAYQLPCINDQLAL